MRIVTASERESANAKLHAEAERRRALMTKEELDKLHGRRHQGEREKARRLKRMEKQS